MLSEEEGKSIKAQLLKQTENLPESQREQVKNQIEEMNPEELEEFLKQQGMIKESESKKDNECIFCSILEGRVSAYKIDENKKALAILEINPLSPGHSIIISKHHNKLPSSAFSLANRVAKRIKSKLKAQEVKIENASLFGHQLINIIPLYKGKNLEKKKLEERELILMQEKLKAKPRIKKQKKQAIEIKLEQAPQRIP